MTWNDSFVVYRLGTEGSLTEVYHTSDMQKAKYWMLYIAEPGDVLCRTPKHAKHSKQTTIAEYWMHKEGPGKTLMEETKWRSEAQARNWNASFPEQPQVTKS